MNGSDAGLTRREWIAGAGAGAAAIAFDSTYPEADRNAAAELLEGAGDALDQALFLELAGRHVHRDRDRHACSHLPVAASARWELRLCQSDRKQHLRRYADEHADG